MFKKRKRQPNLRKRGESVKEDESEQTNVPKKTKLQKGLTSTTPNFQKQKEIFSFSSSESAKPDGEGDQYAAILMENKDLPVEHGEKGDKIDEETGKRVYQGLEAYTKPNVGSRAGPLKGSTNLRVTCRFDYQPDICKDYKETGYCGYGDSCKFLHDRGDYKTGWQLESEWEQQQKKTREQALLRTVVELGGDPEDNLYEIKEEDDGLPFACFICKNTFVNPVVTRCKHYFCESCATTRYVKDPRCIVCKENTNGIFNVAQEIIKKINRNGQNFTKKENSTDQEDQDVEEYGEE